MASNRSRHPSRHIAALLPRYTRGQLTADEILRVRRHVQACATCREELALQTALVRKATLEMEALIPPSMSLLEGVWAKVASPTPAAAPSGQAPLLAQRLSWLWALIRVQSRLLPKGLWVASTMAMTLAILIGMAWHGGTFPSFVLGLVITPVAAAGGALLYGPEHDPGLEVTLATCTPPRMVLLCRFLLALFYDCAAALLASITLALARSVSLPDLVSSWLGPTLLITGLSVFVSVRRGSTVAYAVVAGLLCVRLLSLLAGGSDGRAVPLLGLLWQTTPLVLAAALVLYAAAMLSVPREVHVL